MPHPLQFQQNEQDDFEYICSSSEYKTIMETNRKLKEQIQNLFVENIQLKQQLANKNQQIKKFNKLERTYFTSVLELSQTLLRFEQQQAKLSGRTYFSPCKYRHNINSQKQQAQEYDKDQMSPQMMAHIYSSKSNSSQNGDLGITAVISRQFQGGDSLSSSRFFRGNLRKGSDFDGLWYSSEWMAQIAKVQLETMIKQEKLVFCQALRKVQKRFQKLKVQVDKILAEILQKGQSYID